MENVVSGIPASTRKMHETRGGERQRPFTKLIKTGEPECVRGVPLDARA